MTEKRWRILISAFIIWNAVAIPASTSKPKEDHSFYQKFFGPYLTWTRLRQRWRLFTPQPHKYAAKYRTEITFKEGTTTQWWRPYPENWSFFQRHLAYNFQKYDLAANYLLRPSFTHKDLAKFVERLHWSDENPPKTIKLVRSTALWPPFDGKPRYLREHVDSLDWVDRTIFVYNVKEERFEDF